MKKEDKNLTNFINSDLNEEYESVIMHYVGLGTGYASASITLASGVVCNQPGLIIASGAVFLISLGATGLEFFTGTRKERKERIKPLKQAKEKYKRMYKERKFEIKEKYLEEKEKDGKKPYVKTKNQFK